MRFLCLLSIYFLCIGGSFVNAQTVYKTETNGYLEVTCKAISSNKKGIEDQAIKQSLKDLIMNGIDGYNLNKPLTTQASRANNPQYIDKMIEERKVLYVKESSLLTGPEKVDGNWQADVNIKLYIGVIKKELTQKNVIASAATSTKNIKKTSSKPQNTIAQIKKIVMLKPIALSNGVTDVVSNLVREGLTQTLSSDQHYSAFIRSDIDQLDIEDKTLGTLTNSEREKLDSISNADYACMTKISKEHNTYYIEASMVHLASGILVNPGRGYAKSGIPSINLACKQAVSTMSDNEHEAAKLIPQKSGNHTDNAVLLASNTRSGQATSPNLTMPPDINIISPKNNGSYTNQLQTVEFEIASEELINQNNLFVEINGMTTKNISEFQYNNGKGSFVVRLPRRGNCVLSVNTKNQYSYGKPSKISLRQSSIQTKPRLNILAIGINNYENNEIVDLDFAAKDAADFSHSLNVLCSDTYDTVNVKLLVNEQATKVSILEGLEWIEQNSTQNDVSIIYIAGHGGVDNNDSYYFYPYEANPNSLRSSCLSYKEFNQTMNTLVEDMESKAIFLTDACHSGGAFKTRSASSKSFTEEITSVDAGAYSFASSTGNQKSIEDKQWGNGAFTEALLLGLKGEADSNNDHEISILELISYTTDKVRTLTNYKQTPMHRTLEGNDFPLAVIK